MIVAPLHGLVFLAQTKCASTAIQEVLQPFAVLATRRDPPLKHVHYRDFAKFFEPLLDRFGYPRRSYEVVALMREPIDWLHSWYRYRTRPELADPANPRHEHYVGDLPFEGFAHHYMEGGGGFADVGRQVEFLLDESGELGVDRLFRYEDLDLFLEYLEGKVGQLPGLPVVNQSPPLDLDLGPSVRSELEDFLRPEYELHKEASGALRPALAPTERADDLPRLEGISQAREAATPLVVVIGTGRIAPGAVTGALERDGLPLAGEVADGGSSGSAWLTDFHDAVAREAHVDLRRPRPQAIVELTRHPRFDEWADEALRWLMPQIVELSPVCINDPGLTWTLPIWGQVAAALDRRLKVVVVIRDPASYVRAQTRRYREEASYGRRVARSVETWLTTALGAEWASRGFDRCVVAYSRLLKDPGVEMTRLRNSIRRNPPVRGWTAERPSNGCGRSPTAAMPPGMPSALGHPSTIWPTASIGNCCKQPPSRQEGPSTPVIWQGWMNSPRSTSPSTRGGSTSRCGPEPCRCRD